MPQCIELKVGDCRVYLEGLDDDSIQAFISDPPYDLTGDNNKGGKKKKASTKGFMNKSWDASGITFSKAFWELVYKKATPGAVVKFFGSPRTYHKMCDAMEKGGFVDVQFSKNWIYGSGFPKNTNISKQIDKSLGKVREVIGTKKGIGGENLNDMVRGSLLVRDTSRKGAKGIGAYGTGAKQVSVDVPVTAPASEEAIKYDGTGTALKPAWEPIIMARKPLGKKKLLSPPVTEQVWTEEMEAKWGPPCYAKDFLDPPPSPDIHANKGFLGCPDLSKDFLEPPPDIEETRESFSCPYGPSPYADDQISTLPQDDVSELEELIESEDFAKPLEQLEFSNDDLEDVLDEFENGQSTSEDEDELEMKLQEHVRKMAAEIKYGDGEQLAELMEGLFKECGEGVAAHQMATNSLEGLKAFDEDEIIDLQAQVEVLEEKLEDIEGEIQAVEEGSAEWEEKSNELDSKCDVLVQDNVELKLQVEELTEFKVKHESRDSC